MPPPPCTRSDSAATLAHKLHRLLIKLGIEPGLPFEEQLEAATELDDAARRLPRVYAQRDEALQKLRELDDANHTLRAGLQHVRTGPPQSMTLYRCEGCGQITGSHHHAERCCLCGPVAQVAA